MNTAAIRVLIVDDSAVVRQVLSAVLGSASDLRVIATAADPLIAMERMAVEWPDVVLLDVEMPRMDGISFLKKIMAERPTPVVVCSTLTEAGAATTLQALAAGAVNVVAKPKFGLKGFLEENAREFVQAIREAARARPRAIGARGSGAARPVAQAANAAAAARASAMATTENVVAIGTSTGGTQALEQVLVALPRLVAGIVIVQHMPEKFTASFAKRLDSLSEIDVKEAEHGDRVLPGRALIAPGGLHMRVVRSGALYRVEVLDGPPVNRHKPSVDVLFRSVAQYAGANALGVLMTGMGDDGARGLLDMRQAGARTVAQDEASCVVFGMPREAIRLGAAETVVPLDGIADEIIAVSTLDLQRRASPSVRP
ncbi:protein-glutamate methylesterase/protein-glutamine glutaminase [Aquimonas voraii]|uniref:Protein-glutamate methylesterase/protein-glutamine glutaminase n=1 Tax=Aquimonas voraii TaxID=265719 RepID=A0A1G6ZHV8_9GAMM|nr:chemotaxis response regulator protein-glutamate methylesterase [Aquimonas voraii]SDE02081.1 two-component system, chemotaxis family, response regulator CheB [Aquimonas voraii]